MSLSFAELPPTLDSDIFVDFEDVNFPTICNSAGFCYYQYYLHANASPYAFGQGVLFGGGSSIVADIKHEENGIPGIAPSIGIGADGKASMWSGGFTGISFDTAKNPNLNFVKRVTMMATLWNYHGTTQEVSYGTVEVSGPGAATVTTTGALRAMIVVDALPNKYIKSLSVTGYPPNPQGIIGNSMVLDNIRIEAEPGVDLSVSEVKLSQAVYDPDINSNGRVDLVAGRETLIEATLKADGLSEPREVAFRAIVNGQAVASANVTVSNGLNKTKALFFTPTAVGNSLELKVEVDPGNETIEQNENNNFSSTKTFEVRNTRQLGLAYFGIDHCIGSSSGGYCYGPRPGNSGDQIAFRSQLGIHVQQSNRYLNATFPLSASGLNAQLVRPDLGGSAANDFNSVAGSSNGLTDDFFLLTRELKRSAPWAEKAIAIVPDTYFPYHGHGTAQLEGIRGIAYLGGNPPVAFVEVNQWVTVAHELGHLFGLGHASPSQVSQYWVSERTPVVARDLMDSLGGVAANSLYRWISPSTFSALMSNLIGPAVDPEVILISGILKNDGIFESKPLLLLPEGLVSGSVDGALSVELISESGAVISTIQQDVQFMIETTTDVSSSLSAVNEVPIAVSIPYSENLAEVRVLWQGQVVYTLKPDSNLLREAVQGIPSFAYRTAADQRKRHLLQDISIFEGLILKNNYSAALGLLSAIRNKISNWLLDDYQRTNTYEYEKSEILTIIDAVSNHVAGRIERNGGFALNHSGNPLLDRRDEVLQGVTAAMDALKSQKNK